MKQIYETPVATVITMAAVEKMAALDDHPGEGLSRSSDFVEASTTTGSGRPK